MTTMSAARANTNMPWARALVGFFALLHLATGAALLFAPRWFFDTIGTFPPFNRHYAGDLGAFQVGLGVGLALAARDPARHRLLLVAVAAGNVAHALNHAYDAIIGGVPASIWLSDVGPVALAGLILALLTVRLPAAKERLLPGSAE